MFPWGHFGSARTEGRGWTTSLSLLPSPSGFREAVAHRSWVLAPLLFPFRKAHLSPLGAAVPGPLPRSPLFELTSPGTAILPAAIGHVSHKRPIPRSKLEGQGDNRKPTGLAGSPTLASETLTVRKLIFCFSFARRLSLILSRLRTQRSGLPMRCCSPHDGETGKDLCGSG